jgi:site-specific recombinase XerD
MASKPRPRPPYLQREKTRHGRHVWFVRIGKGPRIRIRGEYGTNEFWTAYHAAVSGDLVQASRIKASPNSLEWLIQQFMDSAAWASLSLATRRQRENIFQHVVKTAGNNAYTAVTKSDITAGIDRRRDRPAAAKHFRQTMRGLFQWAVSAQHVENDPTDGIKLPRRKRTNGFKPWSPEWCAAYEARWPLGTHERVWFEVLYCTGLRRSDAVRFGRQHIDKRGRAMIRAVKNDETAYFLVDDRLTAALAAGPTGDLTFIVGKRGHPLTKESFGNYFREACRAAGVPGAAHGIRKTRATIEAEKGASGAKLDALFGWRTGSNTSAIYIQAANRARLAFGEDADEPNENIYARTLPSGAGASAKKP